MKISILLLLSLLFIIRVNAQQGERIYKIQQVTIVNSSGTSQQDVRYDFQSSNNPTSNKVSMSGNFNNIGKTFLVYTTEDIDTKFKIILDSLNNYKIDYKSNRKIDFDSMKIYFLDIQKNLKKSIDSIPQIVATTDVATLLKASIIQDLKETEISNLKDEISALHNSIEFLKAQVNELKKKTSK